MNFSTFLTNFVSIITILSGLTAFVTPFILLRHHIRTKKISVTKKELVLLLTCILLLILFIGGATWLIGSAGNSSAQNEYKQITSSNPDIEDTLQNNTKGNDWMERSDKYGACIFHNGGYHVISRLRGNSSACVSQVFTVRNFAFQANMIFVLGSTHENTAGLFFRNRVVNFHDEKGDEPLYYRYYLTPDGYYGLEKAIYTNDREGWRILTLFQEKSTAIKTGIGQTNQLTVIAKDDVIKIYVNDQYLYNVKDTDYYSGGQIGFQAGITPTEAIFSNAKLWNL